MFSGKWIEANFLGIVCGALVLAGCELKPTRGRATSELDPRRIERVLKSAIPITPETVILDARPLFEYELGHVTGSYHFPWFWLAESQLQPTLPKDLEAVSRRMAIMGLDRNTPVVVVGNGRLGRGEEGRLAWTLLWLGFEHVEVASLKYFEPQVDRLEPPPREAKQTINWQGKSNWVSSKADFKRVISSPRIYPQHRVHILDVRSKAEYFNKVKGSASYQYPDIQSLHIEWQEFFDMKGRPAFKVRQQLIDIGVQPTDPIYVLSNQGTRSAAVAFALMKLGFQKVHNVSEGWSALMVR